MALNIPIILIATNIGGNYFTDFELFGVRGYDATAWIGMIVGLLISGGITYLIFRKRS